MVPVAHQTQPVRSPFVDSRRVQLSIDSCPSRPPKPFSLQTRHPVDRIDPPRNWQISILDHRLHGVFGRDRSSTHHSSLMRWSYSRSTHFTCSGLADEKDMPRRVGSQGTTSASRIAAPGYLSRSISYILPRDRRICRARGVCTSPLSSSTRRCLDDRCQRNVEGCCQPGDQPCVGSSYRNRALASPMIGFLRRDSEGPLAGVRWNRTSAVANSIPSAGEPAMRSSWASLICMLLTSVLVRAADIPVLQNVDRRIQKEPEYVAKQPLYGLLVFGPTAQAHLDGARPFEAGIWALRRAVH